MNLYLIYHSLMDGAPVTRSCWEGGGQIHLVNSAFHYTNDAGDKEPYELTTDDILANDWEPVNLEMIETPIPMMEGTPAVKPTWTGKMGPNPFE